MRVVHIVKDNVGATFALDEVEYLSGRGVDLTTIIPAGWPGGMIDRYRAAALKTLDLDPNLYPLDPVRNLQNGRRLRRALLELKPDIVHVHHVGPCILLRLTTGRRPPFERIFEVHGPLHLESPHTRWLDLTTRGPHDHYLVTSEATQRLYLRFGVAPERMTTVYSGLRTENYIRPRNGKLRSILAVGPDTPLIGMVAWMYPPKRILGQLKGLKGHDLFIRAIPLIRRQVPDARFVIIGGELNGAEKYAAMLKRMAARLGLMDVLTFLGARSDVAELQPDLDVAVHPSRSENPGGAVYTLLAGVPTAGSSVGGIPEIIHHGDTGLLFPPDNVEALAVAVIGLLREPAKAQEMALRGQDLAKELFDIQETAPHVVGLYRRVIELRERRGRSLEAYKEEGTRPSAEAREGDVRNNGKPSIASARGNDHAK